MLRYPILATLCLLVTGVFANEIKVVIPASKPSRPATFNWKFKSANGQPAQVGQFACGSYWVAPAAGDSGVTFVSLTGSTEWKDLLSCDADPWTDKHGLLSGKKNYGSYDATENVLPKLPVTYKPKSNSCISLVAACQRDEAATSPGGTRQIKGEVVDAYCVVTVMPKAPKNAGKDMIRPNITGATKEFLTWNDFDLNRIPQHVFIPTRTAKSWSGTQRRWRNNTEVFSVACEYKSKRHGMQFRKFSEGGRAFRAHLLVADYGSGMAGAFHGDVLSLFGTDGVTDAKKAALASMLAFGLDLYHAKYDNGTMPRRAWSCGAGQSMGQFLAPVLLAALSRDETKAHQLRKVAATNFSKERFERGPQEIHQIKRGITGVLLWGDGHCNYRSSNKLSARDWRYWADFTGSKCYDSYPGKGNPHRGKKTAADPYCYIDGPANKPGGAYMSVSFGPFRSFASAMILMPHIRNVVNTDAPIEYVDRMVRHGVWTWPDPVAAPSKVDQEGCTTWWSPKGCKEWGVTWGPNPNDVTFAIEDGKGRFKSLHGAGKGSKRGYENGTALRNWSGIIAMYKGRKFEQNVVKLGEVVAPEIFFETGSAPKAHLFCPTPYANIHYTLDGSTPTKTSPQYTGQPIPVSPGVKVKVFAELEGKKSSPVRTATLPLPLSAIK